MIYWITGKANSGKTTLAKRIAKLLRSRGKFVLVLDGDDYRNTVHDFGYDKLGRISNIEYITGVAELAEKQGIIVVIALLSPFSYWRKRFIRRFKKSKLIYIKGGKLWPNTIYEPPMRDENPIVLGPVKKKTSFWELDSRIKKIMEEGMAWSFDIRD